MIFYGSKASRMGDMHISGTNCSFCGAQTNQHVSVFGKYAHLYWIPLFPIGKTAVAECSICKHTAPQKEFSGELRRKYEALNNDVKRPVWHWSGLGIIGVLIIFFGFIKGTAEVDPRNELLNADLAQLSVNPTAETDSVSFKMQNLFTTLVNEEIKPQEFEYLTKVEGDKVLILVKVPELKNVEKEARKEVIEMIEMVANTQETIKDKEKYIGVHGKYNMMMQKTAAGLESSNMIVPTALYEFYGPKPMTEN
jgi:hypothetical protein